MRILTSEEMESFRQWANEHDWFRLESKLATIGSLIRHTFITPSGQVVEMVERPERAS